MTEGSLPVFAIQPIRPCSTESTVFLFDWYGTWQSDDEGISETKIIKKTLGTSYGKMLNLVYQNWYTMFIIELRLSVDIGVLIYLVYNLIYQVYEKCIFWYTRFIKNMAVYNRLPYTFNMLKNEGVGTGVQPEGESGGEEI